MLLIDRHFVVHSPILQHYLAQVEMTASLAEWYACAYRRSKGFRLSALDVIQVKRVYNLRMTVFRYGREHYEDGEYVRYLEAVPGDGRDPVVRIVEDLGTIEIPCGKVDCRANCLEYLVRSSRKREDYSLAECKLSPLVSII
jgi:hypothetical protein